MKKKILYVITKSNWGGAQRYVYDLATSLPDAFACAVVSGGDGVLKEKLEAKHIRTISCPPLQRDISLFADVVSFFRLWNIFRKEKPAIVHLNSSKAGGIGSLAARIAGVPNIIFTAHAWAFNENRSALAKSLIRLAHWCTIILSHHTIVVSNALAKEMGWLPFTGTKSTVIPNGVGDIDMLPKEDARRALSVMHPALDPFLRDPWIGTVAELHPVKGLSYAIEAIPLLTHAFPRLRYLILGEGEQRAALLRLIAEHGLEKQVFLLGFVDDARRFGKAYDLFVLPSLSESFSISLLEAGRAGTPVVATNVGGIPELIHSGITGRLIAPRSSKAIAQAAEETLRDTEESSHMADAFRRNMRERFSLSRMVSDTLALYH